MRRECGTCEVFLKAWSSRCSLLLVLFSLAAGCGYKSAASQRLDHGIRTVAVLPLENLSTAVEVEQALTRELIHALVEKSGYRVINDPSQADAVLSGTVLSLRASPVLFGRSTLGSAYLVTMRASVEFKDRNSGRILFSNNDYIFREQYQINADVDAFFSEQNPAIARIARDFANAVVSTVLEDY